MLAGYLPLKELQSSLPLKQLEELSQLLGTLEPGKTNLEVVTDKEFLGKFYETFVGADLLSRPNHRRRLLSYLPDAQIRKLGAILGVDSSKKYEDVLGDISSMSWGPNESTAKTLEFLGLPLEFIPEPLVSPAASEVISPLKPPHRNLYDYQYKVLFRALDVIKLPCARMLVQMPTGSGKTRTAMEIVAAFFNLKPASRVLWLAHTEELCEQAAVTFEQIWKHLGTLPVSLTRLWGEYNPLIASSAPCIIVAGFAKLNRLRYSNNSISADLIVIDEAHMILAPTFFASVKWAKTLNSRIVGLSATPGRGRRDEFGNQALADFFNQRTIGIETDGEGVITYLQRKGILSKPLREPLLTQISFHLNHEEWRRLEEEFEYPQSFLERVAQDHERNKIIIRELWKLAADRAQVLVFGASVEQSRLLCAALLYKGLKAAHIDGDTSKENRRAAIAKFRRGEINYLCNYGVLATGFDSPNTDVVFITRPTKSIVLYSQMIGRGMRGPAMGGTQTFRLIDVIDNIVDYSSDADDVYEYFADYWG
jgi:DNA repair protein RadD